MPGRMSARPPAPASPCPTNQPVLSARPRTMPCPGTPRRCRRSQPHRPARGSPQTAGSRASTAACRPSTPSAHRTASKPLRSSPPPQSVTGSGRALAARPCEPIRSVRSACPGSTSQAPGARSRHPPLYFAPAAAPRVHPAPWPYPWRPCREPPSSVLPGYPPILAARNCPGNEECF